MNTGSGISHLAYRALDLIQNVALAGKAASREARDPSATMFARIRQQLTLWYTGVLAAALILFGVALYVGVEHALFDPITSSLQQRAAQFGSVWQQLPGPRCGAMGAAPGTLWACYDANGNPLRASGIAQVVPNFVSPSLARSAVQSGPVLDRVDAGGDLGVIQRYTTAVTDDNGNFLGVVEVGVPVGQELHALNILLVLLQAFGALALLVATVGGLFLSHRALVPARLAFNRQQSFIGDASHELRAPLTMLRADAEVLLRGREHLPVEDASLLEDIVGEVAHMSTLTTNMLTMARLDSGRFKGEHDVVDLADVAYAVVRRASSLAAERGIHLALESATPAVVIGDRVLLEQATLVLVDNAIKYNRPGGSVIVRTGVSEGRASLEVRDTGIGIAPEHLPHLGERFYRVDKARSREDGGAGLGLSIARGIADQHHGHLIVSSTPGQGTSATLALPAARATAAESPVAT